MVAEALLEPDQAVRRKRYCTVDGSCGFQLQEAKFRISLNNGTLHFQKSRKAGLAGLSQYQDLKVFSRSCALEAVCGNLARTLVADQFVGDLLTVLELAEAGALNGRDVNEYVLRTVVRLNEAVAFGCVEPLYSTGSHNDAFPLQI
jgi:hypothetical protein